MNPPTQQPPIDWNSGDHGVILNDGTKVPYNQLQQVDPQLYSQYVEHLGQPAASLQQTQTSTQATQAQIPGIQATSSKEQIQAQQAAALKNLGSDLQNKMTLPSALKKYTSLGMNPDDIFNQYLAQSPWGLPQENPQKLQEMGVSAKALGNIGTPGSFMDRYNTKNAIEGLRTLEGLWNHTNTLSKLPFLGGATPSGKAYESARQIFGEHLSSLIPGASGAQGSVTDLLNTLPDVGHITETEPGAAQGQFKAVEDQLLAAKGYSHKDLGIDPRSTTNQQQTNGKAPVAKGGDLLTTLLSGAGKDLEGVVSGMSTNPLLTNILDPNAVKQSVQAGANAPAATANEYGDLLQHPIQHAIEHPVNTLMDLAPLLGLKGGEGAPEGGTGEAAPKNMPNEPGKLQQLLSPGKAKNVIGEIRDNIISQGDKAGGVVSGDSLAQNIRSWAENAKLSNLPDADAIESAAANAEKLYAGKSFKPSELKGIYDSIEKGYTKTGQPRTATSSYIDRGLKDVIADQLDKVAPGFKRTSQLFDQTYKAEKSPVRAVIKSGSKNAVGYGLGIAGFDAVRHILGL